MALRSGGLQVAGGKAQHSPEPRQMLVGVTRTDLCP